MYCFSYPTNIKRKVRSSIVKFELWLKQDRNTIHKHKNCDKQELEWTVYYNTNQDYNHMKTSS